ncbi:TonB-dependent receptor [Marinilabilia rubra]|uniref:TonB-dependent receptor n=2 Tax=Marinilabilia rubra TaxID=2162893 RepID=A0A2U2B5G9_9BACT|nr:TonB-dependent receptor [Marinilabilia rubra]
MRKMSFLFLMTILLFVSAGLNGQVTVTGKVIDKDTQEPLIGAAIVVEGTSKGTVTNLNGSFELPVEQKQQTLLFKYLGYGDHKETINPGNDGLDMGTISMKSNVVGLNEVLVLTSFARDKETPVALSTIQPATIDEKLGSLEFPQILKSTPSVYATRGSGGFGDSRIYLRGFDTNNIGVLINGVPVNDMENGRVYWSNWSGLSDVTKTMQVQRGLGASKLALSSVGGTINILTNSTDVAKGGSFYSAVGNNGYRKQSVNASTGLMENNWSVSLMGTHTYGDGYINGTSFDAWTYFMNVSKIINDQHRISFTAFGAPQWHNQRGTASKIQAYRDDPDGIRRNLSYGIRDGKIYGGGYGYNEYHKPQLSLNHYWNIDKNTIISTALYASVSQGGGRRVDGENGDWLNIDYDTGEPTNITLQTPDGLLDFEEAARRNGESLTGSKAFVGMSVNQHQWYGLLSTMNKELGNINITGGFDGRYYIGEHYKEITDLLGGEYFLDDESINRPESTPLKEGDKYAYHNDGVVAWGGLFGQMEYVGANYSAFLTASVSQKSYQRIDYFQYEPDNQKSDWVNFTPWSVKLGANYNATEEHNFFVNGGYFTRAPYFSTIFLNYTNEINDGAKYEKVLSFDVGYGFSLPNFSAKINGYWTNWQDKGLVRSFNNETANIPGINALHTGIESEIFWKPIPELYIKGMFSWGDWTWEDDIDFSLFDDNNDLIDSYSAYIGGVHVGNSAQITSALRVDYEIFPGLKLGADVNYYGKNYAEFDPTNRTKENEKTDSWQLPDYNTVDMNLKYDFNIGSLDASLYGKVNNLLNTEYIADARDGDKHNAETALVYYGFGTTWSTGLKIKF